MEIRDKGLYDALKEYLKGVYDSSLDWRPCSSQFKDLLDFLRAQDCVVSTVCWWEPEAAPREEISRWTRAFSHSYQNKLGGLVWDENVFNETYERFEDFLYSKELIVTSVAPIYLFECALKEPLELDAQTGIVPKEYDANIKSLLSHFDAGGRHFSETYDWCIYTRRKMSKAQPRESTFSDSENTLKVADVLTSLRLLHSGLMHAGPIHSDEGSPFAGIQGGSRSLGSSIFKRLSADYIVFQRYTLKDEEIEIERRIYSQLNGLTRSGRERLDIPISRFNDSYERGTDRDRLIDLCIALESLFVRQIDELKYRLALRCACFLEQEREDLQNTFLRVGRIYRTRSVIVHGTGKQPKQDELYELVTGAEDYVRRSICKLLSDKSYVDRISKEPEENEIHFLDKLVFDKHLGTTTDE